MMKKALTKKVLASVLLGTGIMVGSVAFAEDVAPAFELDQIIVTAGRVEQTIQDANASVNVVTRKEIEQKHYQSVSEALRNIPGVNVQNYAATGSNYSSNRLYLNGTNQIVVMVDGMRVNTNGSTSSVFEPSEVSNMDNIERIEVLKGSASTLYGSDAVGGVINIITRKPTAGVATKVSAAVGSYDKTVFNVYNQGMTDSGFYWTVSGQKEDMKDYKDGYHNKIVNRVDAQTYGVKLGQKFGEKADVNVSYSKYKNDYVRPDNGSADKTKDYGKKDNTRVALNFVYNFNENLSNNFSVFKKESKLDDNYKNMYGRWIMNESDWGISDQITYKKGHHTIIGGYDYYKNKLDKYQYGTGDPMSPSVDNKAFFLQDTMEFGPLTITPGIRYSKHSVYGGKTTPSGVIGYKTSDATNVYVSYKKFFRSPFLYELYDKTAGSTDLNPEEGKTKEIGINTRIDSKTTFSAHYFRTNAKNMISWAWTGPGAWDGCYQNTGKEKYDGFDLQLSKQFDDHVSMTASYTQIKINAASPYVNENRDGYIPKHVYDIRLNYDNAKFDGFVTLKGIGDRPGRKSIEKDVEDGFKSFWTMDAGVGYKPTKGLNIFLKANNIFNKMYTEALYDMRNPGGSGWYSQPGRNFLVGVEYSF